MTARRARALVVSACLIAVALPAQALADPAGGDGAELVPGELLVRFEPGTSRAQGNAAARRLGARVSARAEIVPNLAVVELPPGLGVGAADRRFSALAEVASAEPNFVYRAQLIPDDPGFGQLWGLDNTGQLGGLADADIDAPEAWELTTGDPAVTVAVVDTGVASAHPDLDDNLWTNPGEVPGNEIDDDGNGRIDDVVGWDFVNDDASPDDDHGHGTHVAGTVGAEGNNDEGVAGVNWEVGLMALKAGGADGKLTSDDLIDAFEYADEQGASVVNASFSGNGHSTMVEAAMAAADQVLFVAAAGNGGPDGKGDDNDASPQYPCTSALPNVICVAAGNRFDVLAGFSNFGKQTVDLAAPGVSVLSTVPGDLYGSKSGTSMAAPHVAGTAALLLAGDPAYGVADLRAALLNNVDRLDPLECKLVTGGRLNAHAALLEGAATPPLEPPDCPPPPTTTIAQIPVSIPATTTSSQAGKRGCKQKRARRARIKCKRKRCKRKASRVKRQRCLRKHPAPRRRR